MVAPLLCTDPAELAPGIQDRFNKAEADAQSAGIRIRGGETYRDPRVEAAYFSIGRDPRTGAIVDPPVVTNAHDGSGSWHCYRAARDYDFDPAHTADVVAIFARYRLAWGGAWPHLHDTPHFQPAELPASPTTADRADFRRGDLASVWARYSLGYEA